MVFFLKKKKKRKTERRRKMICGKGFFVNEMLNREETGRTQRENAPNGGYFTIGI